MPTSHALPYALLLALFSPLVASAAGLQYWNETVASRPAIASAQRALRAEGYDPGPADGKLHPKTAEAVMQAQKERELEPTGRLDRRTAAALGVPSERLRPSLSPRAGAPTPSPRRSRPDRP
jgi:peptidoglycan hydrolase-like protein with peptidoglycan-binding domain